jgi:ribokinase
MKPKLVVVGSANRDLVVKTERIPAPGETVIGGAFVTAPGGKGGNQAVAAARLGAEVWFVGRVGRDIFGDALADEMIAAGIHVDFLRRDDIEPTGVALIGVDARGENAIIVAPGANHRLGRNDILAALPAIAQAYSLIVQLEIPLETVEAAIDAAIAAGTKVILNPAPVNHANPLTDSLLAKIDVLTPNEHEAAQLLGYASPNDLDWETAAQRLRAKGIGAVVITLGEAGCVLADAIGTRRIPSVPVHAIDTTAAGDCFTGALAVGLAEGLSLDDAARFASRAAALSVSRLGAQPSLPTRSEVDAIPFPS